MNGSKASLSSQNSSGRTNTNNNLHSDSIGTSENSSPSELTWIHELFQGILVNETKCLNCETVRTELYKNIKI